MAEIRKIRVDGTDYDVRDTSKIPVNQGTANAGKIMQVGADGNLTPTAALDDKVNNTQTVNGKTLNANITLDANDVPYDDDPEAEIIVGSVGSALFQRPQYNQVVRVDSEQSLTDVQKVTGRGNIDAASADEVSELKSAFDSLADYSVSIGTNKCNPSTMSNGRYNASNDGVTAPTFVESSGYDITDFIPLSGNRYVCGGTYYNSAFRNFMSGICAFDASKNPIGSVTGVNTVFDIQTIVGYANAVYIRAWWDKSVYDDHYFIGLNNTGAAYTSYEAYSETASVGIKEDVNIPQVDAIAGSIEQQYDNIKKSIYPLQDNDQTFYADHVRLSKLATNSTYLNIFDAESAQDGYGIDSEGKPTPNNNYALSGFIVLSGTSQHLRGLHISNGVVVGNSHNYIAFYNSNHVFIQRLVGTAYAEIPENAKYARIAVEISVKSTVMWFEIDQNTYNNSNKYSPYMDGLGNSYKFADDFDKLAYFGIGTNKCNQAAMSDGRYTEVNDGETAPTFVGSTGYTMTDYIPIGGKWLTASAFNNNGYFKSEFNGVCVFDANKNPIASKASTNEPLNLETQFPYSGLAYLKVWWAKNSYASGYMVSFSDSKVTNPYIPYSSAEIVQINGDVWTNPAPWFSGKTGELLGDSITQQAQWVGAVSYSLNCKTNNRGIGGTPITGTNANAFWQDVRVNSLDNDSDFVIIMGGTNDTGLSGFSIGTISRTNHDTNTLCGAYNVLLSKLFYKYLGLSTGYYANDGISYDGTNKRSTAKKVPIFVCTPIYCAYAGHDNMDDVAEAVKKIAAMWAVPCIDINGNSGINAFTADLYLADAMHPNYNGGVMLARAMVDGLIENQPFDFMI